MITLQKNTSQEGGNFNGTTKKVCNITIDDDGIYDLSKSYLSLDCEITATDPSGGIHNVGLAYGVQSLIRNVDVSTERTQDLENLTRNNVLRTNVNDYVKSHRERDNQGLWNGQFQEDEFGNRRACFRDLNDDANSVERTAELQLPLRAFLGIGGISQYPAMMCGDTNIRLEFEDPTLLIQEKHRYTAGSSLSLEDLGAGATNTLDASGYLTQQQLGLWVNQRVLISYDASGNFTHETEISSITDPSNNSIQFSVKDQIPASAVAKTNVELSEVSATTKSYSIVEANLVLVKNNPTDKQLQAIKTAFSRGVDIPYITFNVEQDNLNAGNEYNRQFYLEPNCLGSLLFFTDGNNQKSDLTNVSSYRTRTNGENNTSEDVEVNSSLYKDRVLFTLSSLGNRVKSLRDVPFVVANPNPQGQENQLSVVVNGANMPARNVNLYKAVERVLSVKGNSISVQ